MQQREIILLILLSSGILITFIVGIVIFLIQYKRKQIKHEVEKQTLSLTFSKEINKAKLEIKDMTLNQIGRELHDNIGQLLTVSKIHSMSLLKLLPDQKKLHDLDDVLGKTINEVKLLSKSLDASRIENFGFAHELRQEVTRLQALGFAQLNVSIPDGFTIDSERGIILYRIVQEFLNNSMKYSQCTTCTIDIKSTGDSVYVSLSDNGKGFDMDIAQSGSGVHNLQKRCELLQATNIKYTSAIGQGTSLAFEIPLQTT